MPLPTNPADYSMMVGWVVAQVCTAGVLYAALSWAQRITLKRMIPAAIAEYFNQRLEDRIMATVNNAIATQVGDLRAHVADVHELVVKATEMQGNVVEATRAMTKLSERFEALYNACPFGQGDGCKLTDSTELV